MEQIPDSTDQLMARYGTSAAVSNVLRATLSPYLTTQSLTKGDCLVKEGRTHAFMYFLTRGSVRSFYLKDGTEMNTWFAFEDEVVGSFQNYLGNPSRETLQVTEDGEATVINVAGVQALAGTDLSVSHFVRLMIEEYTAYLEERVLALQMNATERYRYLIAREPEVLRRIPLTYVASYLGVSRETLSRIRAKVVL